MRRVPLFPNASEENTATRYRCADAIAAALVALGSVAALSLLFALMGVE